MIIVGITGGIGTGKGLATEFFRSRGAAVIDADEIARALAQPGSQMVADIALEFGRCALRPDGSLDRRKLARIVFGDPDAVARLNAITHPPIRAEVERRLESLVRDGTAGVVCLVAPLLLEAGLGDSVDRLLVMTVDEGTRVRRVMARDGVSEDEVRARMAAQMPPCEQVERANWVVDATGGREEALRQLDAIWAELNE